MPSMDDGLQRDAIRATAKSIYESVTGQKWEEAARREQANHYFIAKAALEAGLPLLARTDEQELYELKRLVSQVETKDMGGYTQRDAYEVAETMYAAGYRRALS